MSSAASWSYTSQATHWPLLTRGDWGGTMTFGQPAVFDCDYKAELVSVTNERGIEFVSRQKIYTEKADIKQGDRVLIGVSEVVDPLAAGALEVQSVARYADTFEQLRDDFEVVTGYTATGISNFPDSVLRRVAR